MASSAQSIGFGCELDKSVFAYDWMHDLSFTLHFEMKVSRVMYNNRIPKTDMICQTSCIYLGKSSVISKIEFFVKGHSEPVLSCLEHFVNVDRTTRKTKPYPPFMTEVFGRNLDKSGSGSKIYKQFDRPQNTFVHHFHVAWSDTDFNGHCNFASFARYADDAIHAALRLRCDKTDTPPQGNKSASYKGDPTALKGISKEVVQCGVKNLKLLFAKECLEGHEVDVHIWQDGVKDSVVCCSIERDNEVISQIVIEYFTTNKSKL